jgi:hypothetical protein
MFYYEDFRGGDGSGLGGSHQTGWAGLVARLMHLFATSTAEQFLELGKIAAAVPGEPAPMSDAGVREVSPT